MGLFALGDLHLSFGCEKPMDVFKGWEGYTARLEQNWRACVRPEDTVVLPGDLSWAMTLEEAKPDFAFLEALPGQKLLLKGNHDYWWTTRKKMEDFFAAEGFGSLHIVHNSAYCAEGAAVCGTRGWFFDAADEGQKVLLREAGRLEASLCEAEKTGLEPIVFLHYPPVYAGAVCEEMMRVLTLHGVKRCYYGHLHGPGIKRAVQGLFRGTALFLVSCDAVDFAPVPVPTQNIEKLGASAASSTGKSKPDML